MLVTKKKKTPQTNKQKKQTQKTFVFPQAVCVLDKNFEPKLLPVFLSAENPYQKKKKEWYHVTVDRMGSLDSLTDPKADRAWAYTCVCSHEDSSPRSVASNCFQREHSAQQL